ncbi:hypothetical protein [Chryseobacterium sp. 2987]|uniref:hypothetical protein n=1 Tax=Chryseobacterium sp. 2987 TaxID=2817767 RepID=UPI002855AA58|nr:hypothetical protein [Chryseobacterium sp. 2987]MDR6921932.1 hypothetical protein [Chryseobacterium sp. 2987]
MDKKNQRLIELIKTTRKEYAYKYYISVIPSFLSKKFIAYCSMKEDLEMSLEYIRILKTNPDPIIKSSLTYSLISLYGKCYTDASKNKFPKLEAKNFIEKDSELMATHDFLMNLRHQFIAHRGDTESEVGIAYMLIPKNKSPEQSQMRFRQLKQHSFSNEDLIRFENLINYSIEYLKTAIQKHGQKIYNAMFKLFTPEEIVIMSVNNTK